MPDIDHETSEQTACEACVLLNQAIRELIVPKRVWALVDQWKNVDNPISLNESCAISNMILRGVIMNLYRLRETRKGFLAGWLFTETELLGLGFQPIEQFFPAGTWKCFEMIRHQYAGHATGTEAKPEKKTTRSYPVSGKIRQSTQRNRPRRLENVFGSCSDRSTTGSREGTR
jgi:hypothetical protein